MILPPRRPYTLSFARSADGALRSLPVGEQRDVWDLVARYVDSVSRPDLIDARSVVRIVSFGAWRFQLAIDHRSTQVEVLGIGRAEADPPL
jgi:hypothetical protein